MTGSNLYGFDNRVHCYASDRSDEESCQEDMTDSEED
jgi:hypothetical protein